MACFKVLYEHLAENTQENHEKTSGQLVSVPRFKPGITWIQSRSANNYIKMFGTFGTVTFCFLCMSKPLQLLHPFFMFPTLFWLILSSVSSYALISCMLFSPYFLACNFAFSFVCIELSNHNWNEANELPVQFKWKAK